MTSAVCSKCGFTNRAEAQFCTQCGQALGAAPLGPKENSDLPFADSTAALKPVDARPLPSATAQGAEVICSNCGMANATGSDVCRWCQMPLPPSAIKLKLLSSRPGCVTLYAIALMLGAVANAVSALRFLEDRNTQVVGLVILGIAVAGVTIAFGLLRQKNWARIGVILLMLTSIALLALQALAGAMYALAGLIVPIFIIWWFAKNKEHFE